MCARLVCVSTRLYNVCCTRSPWGKDEAVDFEFDRNFASSCALVLKMG